MTTRKSNVQSNIFACVSNTRGQKLKKARLLLMDKGFFFFVNNNNNNNDVRQNYGRNKDSSLIKN